MINNWDIISHFNSPADTRLFTLVIDGTENDARLIAKKLSGYVQAPEPAQPPFTYAFALPSNLDEDTLDKIRTAVREGTEQANKVNQFVPGGVLGNPLFNTPSAQEQTQDASGPKVEVNPDDSFLKDAPSPETSAPLSADEVFADPEEKPAQEPAPEQASAKEPTKFSEQQPPITLSDKDMLIKDMENTLLGKMPLEDIFSAQTKYDMFMDFQNTPEAQNAKSQQEQKIDQLAQEVAQADESFNIFDQKIKDATSIMDVNDLNQEEHSASQGSLEDTQGVNLSVHSVQTGSEANEQTHSNCQIPEEVALGNTVPPTPIREHSLHHKGDDLPDIAIREQEPEVLEKTFNLESTISMETLRTQYEKSFRAEDPMPMPQSLPTSQEETAETQEEEQNVHPAQGMLHLRLKPKQQPPAPQAPAPKTTLRLRPKPQSPAPQPPAPQAPAKTILRLRPTPQPVPPPAQTPVPPVTPPVMPPVAQPAVPPVMPQLGQPAVPPATNPTTLPPAMQPMPETTMRQAVAANMDKTKTIDYSIELPLSELKKHNWPLEVPLLPTYTLENFVLSVNRFAHATAISVIENPGRMYNPLVFHGTTGTGKTHFLNALAYGFSKKYGQENIFMTNGVRLSRGIQRYVMEGNMEKFEKFMDSVKVLLIDDIHLLAINEQNRAHISKLLNKFLKEQKQIVITSKYPPESLGKLENLIQFHLDSGWISELKAATGPAHFKIVKTMLLGNGVDLSDAQITQFFGGAHMTLSTIMRSIRRLKVLENLVFPHLDESERSQADMFEKLLATAGEDPNSELLSKDPSSITSISTVGNGEWGRLGFFYPSNSSNAMNWMVYALEQRAKELGISGGFDIAVRSSYSTENIISSAFKIANLCDNKKLRGAVILGPALTVCEPSVRENFYDILTHMLEIMLIRCGIINTEALRLPSTYVKVISELLR